jgi:hypothetical protein
MVFQQNRMLRRDPLDNPSEPIVVPLSLATFAQELDDVQKWLGLSSQRYIARGLRSHDLAELTQVCVEFGITASGPPLSDEESQGSSRSKDEGCCAAVKGFRVANVGRFLPTDLA